MTATISADSDQVRAAAEFMITLGDRAGANAALAAVDGDHVGVGADGGDFLDHSLLDCSLLCGRG